MNAEDIDKLIALTILFFCIVFTFEVTTIGIIPSVLCSICIGKHFEKKGYWLS